MLSLNDSLKLNLFHMGRSHYFKNHSNKLNFQNPSNHRSLKLMPSTPTKSFQNSKRIFLRPFHQTLGRQNSNKTKFTILNSVLAKLISHLTPICSHCSLWIKPGHNYPIPYLLAAWP